ncbi:hypothetical protein BC936DRAFT_143954 [Jimgerdemannia flammicorona]|uniref:Fungal-type protein kinase domain-containing protein n=1 Tax=Jimgerdemannia flammicorona TaxID=994334 RepID=A0A432ZYE0_9FUNG|nr:hypothetical protein BC936DRAFT_143954 [Jimgerdemannia flammicorona]
MGKVLYRLSGCILVATPSLQYDFRYIHRIYQHFMDLWMDNPNPLLDKDMSEVTQVIDAISPMLKNLFRGKYRIKWGEIGLEASSFRRNQDVDTNIRRRPGQRTDAILSLRNQLGQELLICEISGPPYDNDLEHFGGDKLKIQKGLRDILNLIAQRAENGDINIFMRLKIYGLQIYGWKAYLYAMDIPHHNLYRFEQVASFRIPQSPEDLLWLPAAIHVLLSLRVWIDQTAEDLEKLYRSSCIWVFGILAAVENH